MFSSRSFWLVYQCSVTDQNLKKLFHPMGKQFFYHALFSVTVHTSMSGLLSDHCRDPSDILL